DIDIKTDGTPYYYRVYVYAAHADAVNTTVTYGTAMYFDAFHAEGEE
ncbi:MAG: hypothetical protein JRH20_31460, partial [Deltaproteobacteria bacterium]|nr:hypothetical protein [Deltaproteobacteria bacterium]